MSEPKPKCNRCGREIQWKKKTLKDGREINAPFELDGSEHSEKVGDVWQCKTVGSKPNLPNTKDQKLDASLTEANVVQALGRIYEEMTKQTMILEQMRDRNDRLLPVL